MRDHIWGQRKRVPARQGQRGGQPDRLLGGGADAILATEFWGFVDTPPPVAFTITVAQTMPAPSQAATAQTAMPVTVEQIMPTPVQVITAEAKVIYQITVAQTMPTPGQIVTAETAPGTAKKPLGAGGPRGAWEYRPPVFAIRTKGRQEAPPPRQKSRARTRQATSGDQAAPLPVQGIRVQYNKKVAYCYGVQRSLAPLQSGNIWPHRLKHVREEEERKIILMLLGFDVDEYERQLNQAEAATVTD
jgi:hypothetical protein